MRLFVALTPPDVVVEELRASTAVLRERVPDLRWTRPEQCHVTLAFLGEVAGEVVDELARGLNRAAAGHPPLSLAFGGGGRVGHRGLWTGVQGNLDELPRLADSVRAAARRSRLPVEQGPYRPHLTLARSDGAADLLPLVERLAPWEGLAWVATWLYLIRSRLLGDLQLGERGSDGYVSVAAVVLVPRAVRVDAADAGHDAVDDVEDGLEPVAAGGGRWGTPLRSASRWMRSPAPVSP